jgi:chloride channel protein, CIC family
MSGTPLVGDAESRPLRGGDGIPVAPGLDLALAEVQGPPSYAPVDRRVIVICALALGIGAAGALIAAILTHLIGFITNLAYFGRISGAFSPPSTERWGVFSVFVPVVGALIVGVMARYGAAAIRGHGIPEVMERVLTGRSRISPKIMFLKPISAAIAIGTGGPFGAEGPIIATGGALGSLVGQIIHVTADERKTLLAAGAAAGMAAIFGCPVSSVLLAVELLLFEYRPRSLVPVALAAVVATGVRIAYQGPAPVFTLQLVGYPSLSALCVYVVLGAVIGLVAVFATRVVYRIEDLYEELPIHWMWWPAVGAVAVGLIGLVDQRTLGVGYENIDHILSGQVIGASLALLIVLKFVSWSVFLGSGTSGGTLAPLFTIGGGIGALFGAGAVALAPSLGVDPHVAALVGMAAIFAGASHALLASVVFAFETTRQPMGLLPLLAGCSTAYLVSLLLMRSSIMTEKLARRGTPVRTEYSADFLDRVFVDWLSTRGPGTSHQGFPVLDDDGLLVGVVTRRDLLDPNADETQPVGQLIRRATVVAFEENTMREAADHMVHEKVGRLPVVSRREPRRVIGIITRTDLLDAHQGRLDAALVTEAPPIGRAWVERQANRALRAARGAGSPG